MTIADNVLERTRCPLFFGSRRWGKGRMSWHLPQMEATLAGAALDEGTAQAAMDVALREARPLPGQD